MSTLLGVGGGSSSRDEAHDWLSVPAGIALLGLGLSLLVWQGRFRLAETQVSAWTIRFLHLRPATTLGTNVLFPLRGRWVGFSVSLGCTAALLVLPFFVIAGVLLLFRRVDQRRVLLALAVSASIIFAVNQLRMVVIAMSMLLWGFQTGYERSHILLGTTLSTVGVIAGIIIFVWMLVESPDRHLDGVGS